MSGLTSSEKQIPRNCWKHWKARVKEGIVGRWARACKAGALPEWLHVPARADGQTLRLFVRHRGSGRDGGVECDADLTDDTHANLVGEVIEHRGAVAQRFLTR